jgi:Predicted membrane protein
MGYSNSNNYLKKDLLLIFVMGMLYMVLEGLWKGWTNIFMLPIGGSCGFLVGRLNEHPAFYNRKMWEQCIIGTLIVLIIEFFSGMILNLLLRLHLWDYSDMWGNFYGQICIPYALLWFVLIPLTIYADDYLRYRLFGEVEPKGLLYNYKLLFTLQ